MRLVFFIIKIKIQHFLQLSHDLQQCRKLFYNLLKRIWVTKQGSFSKPCVFLLQLVRLWHALSCFLSNLPTSAIFINWSWAFFSPVEQLTQRQTQLMQIQKLRSLIFSFKWFDRKLPCLSLNFLHKPVIEVLQFDELIAFSYRSMIAVVILAAS